MPTPGSAPHRPDVSRERADQATNQRVGGRAVLGALVGIDLGDDQPGQLVAPGKDGQVGHRLVEGQVRLVLGMPRHRQIEKVDHIDVEVEEEPVGRGAHPGQRLSFGIRLCRRGTHRPPFGAHQSLWEAVHLHPGVGLPQLWARERCGAVDLRIPPLPGVALQRIRSRR
jgi:hypothetical protein